MPSIVGFGAVLDNLSALLDNLPMATTIAGATTAWLVLWSFLSGGVLDRYARMRPTRAHRILRRVRHALLALPAAGRARAAGVLGALCPRAPVDLRRPLSVDDARHDGGTGGVCRPPGSATWSSDRSSWSSANLVLDYARIRIVVEDRRSAVGALVAGARFVRRHPAALRLYLLNGACFVLLALAYALVAPGAPSGLAIWIALAVGQIYILLRHYVKLLFYASQVSFFQSRLAHAAYTAAPPVVWPDSPAAESIGNA